MAYEHTVDTNGLQTAAVQGNIETISGLSEGDIVAHLAKMNLTESVTVQRLCSGLDRITGEGALQHLQHAVALLSQRIEAGANDAEIFSAFDGAEAA